MPTLSPLKIIILSLFVTALGAFFAFGGADFLTLDYLKEQHAAFQHLLEENPVRIAFIYALIYVVVTAMSFPGAAVITLAAGALFGVLWGTLIVSFASTIGATMAFLAARWLFGDAVRTSYKEKLEKISNGFEKEGAFYVFAIRLTPAIPFFLVNILLAFTPVKIRTFYLMSQIGMLPGTIAYVYAGTELAQLQSLSDILSPSILAAFTALAILPIIARRVISWLRNNKKQSA